jgi:hypothetical protein
LPLHRVSRGGWARQKKSAAGQAFDHENRKTPITPGTVRPQVNARKADAKERFNAMMRFIREGGMARPTGMVEVRSEIHND